MRKPIAIVGKIVVLCTAIALAGSALLLLAWRSDLCAKIASYNAAVPPENITDHVMRRLAFERVCGFSDIFPLWLLFFNGRHGDSLCVALAPQTFINATPHTLTPPASTAVFC